tara:strand:+ start:14574 stop:14822 length:249 start_codon:yes stop_codon:yes gene_type:complete
MENILKGNVHVSDMLISLVPDDMQVPMKRLEMSFGNLSWLCRNLQINNSKHPDIKQTMAKLNMLRQQIALGQMTVSGDIEHA